MDTPQADAVRLAIAFRRLTPPGLDLVFCDEGYNFDIRLGPETTDAELIESMKDA
jgi:hypothetical protein